MVEHQEAWQVFNGAGLPVPGASIAPKESRGNPKVIVGAVHVWIWRKTIDGVEVLLQHRAKDKPTWPDYLDISVAGHIDAGESLEEAIAREAKEEVGAIIPQERPEFIFSYRNFDTGIKWVYLLQQLEDVKYTFNDGEVQALKWVPLSEFIRMTENPEENNLVPHPSEYYSQLNKALAHFV